MAKKLNIGALMGGAVSKLDTSAMSVQDIALDLIDTNPNNKYVISDVDDLAESIAVIGLQQPLVVQPNGERYLLLAGERRYTAVKDKLGWQAAPCVVVAADTDPAIQTLILHWTNTLARGGAGLRGDTLAGAAKEIETALVDLKKRGVVELPGKLREYVADVLQVSVSALARSKAIDNNLIKAFKGDYACKRINDAVAYELSQCDPDLQRKLHGEYKDLMYSLDAKKVNAHRKADTSGFAPLTCPAASDYTREPCVGTDKRAAAVKRGECPGCCHNCEKADGCEWVCGKISKQITSSKSAEERKREHDQALAEFEASPLNKVRLHMRDVLAQYGVTSSAQPEETKYRSSWIWAEDPLSYTGTGLDTVFLLAEYIGVAPQELLFGNPEGAQLRELSEGMRQAEKEGETL